jgi:hypothetical protein
VSKIIEGFSECKSASKKLIVAAQLPMDQTNKTFCRNILTTIKVIINIIFQIYKYQYQQREQRPYF